MNVRKPRKASLILEVRKPRFDKKFNDGFFKAGIHFYKLQK